MKTKFRILPKQFGEYGGEKVFEIEKVCVGTNTMSRNKKSSIRPKPEAVILRSKKVTPSMLYRNEKKMFT